MRRKNQALQDDNGEQSLIKAVFSSAQGVALIDEWKKTHCTKVFAADPLQMARKAGVSDFIHDIETVLNYD